MTKQERSRQGGEAARRGRVQRGRQRGRAERQGGVTEGEAREEEEVVPERWGRGE